MSSVQHLQEQDSAAAEPSDEQGESVYPLEGLGEQDAETQSHRSKRRKGKKAQSGSDTEIEPGRMSSRSSKQPGSSSSKKHGSSSKSTSKTDDWSDITDPEERRRIQNRIAQRKFRGKAREQKDKSERDQRNQEHAGSSYRVPEAGDMAGDGELAPLSGLPWGGVNMRYVVERGSENVSQGSPHNSDQLYGEPQYLSPTHSSTGGYQHGTSWDGSGGDEQYYDQQYDYDDQQAAFYYDYDYDTNSGAHQ